VAPTPSVTTRLDPDRSTANAPCVWCRPPSATAHTRGQSSPPPPAVPLSWCSIILFFFRRLVVFVPSAYLLCVVACLLVISLAAHAPQRPPRSRWKLAVSTWLLYACRAARRQHRCGGLGLRVPALFATRAACGAVTTLPRLGRAARHQAPPCSNRASAEGSRARLPLRVCVVCPRCVGARWRVVQQPQTRRQAVRSSQLRRPVSAWSFCLPLPSLAAVAISVPAVVLVPHRSLRARRLAL